VRHTLLERQTIARLHQLVPQVIAWTVNDVDRALRLRDAGVDGITTDSPEVLAALRP
jgi:glycerophosphoryl diester phosphodiesterase